MACRLALIALPREAIYANIRKNPIKRTALSIIRLADRLLCRFFRLFGGRERDNGLFCYLFQR